MPKAGKIGQTNEEEYRSGRYPAYGHGYWPCRLQLGGRVKSRALNIGRRICTAADGTVATKLVAKEKEGTLRPHARFSSFSSIQLPTD